MMCKSKYVEVQSFAAVLLSNGVTDAPRLCSRRTYDISLGMRQPDISREGGSWKSAQGVHVTFQISSPLVFRTAVSPTPESVICGHFGLLEIATCLGILSNGGGLKKRDLEEGAVIVPEPAIATDIKYENLLH